LAEADIDLMVGASEDSVMMVEGEMDEVSEKKWPMLLNLLTKL